jgi:glycine/D-amino acid oxidase-like deaminating enzyme
MTKATPKSNVFDIAIIGGGIAGISAAAALAPHRSALLLEQEDTLAHHASARSAALYEPNYGNAAVKALSHASGAALRAANVLSRRGLMVLGRAQDVDFAENAKDMNTQEISLGEAEKIFPILNRDIVTRAAYSEYAWDIDTDLLLQSYLKSARANGAQIETRACVTQIIFEDGIWTLTTGKGYFQARRVINAAGPWADTVAAMAGVKPIGIQPYRRSMARLPMDGYDTRGWPMVFSVGETWYCKPDAGALIVSPADEDPMDPHDAWADDMVLAEGLARYEEMVTEPVTRMIANWAGLRSFAPDRALVIGEDARAKGFYWLAGQGGYGFQSAPAAADLIRDLVLGKTPNLPADAVTSLSPARFS